MPYFSDKIARVALQAFLVDLRGELTRKSLDFRRLPGWLTAANVRLGWVNDSVVAVFEDGSVEDVWTTKGQILADTVVLLDTPDFTPGGASLKGRNVPGLILIAGPSGDSGRAVMNLASERPALFDCGYAGYHGPRALCNLFFHLSPPDLDVPGPVATRFVTFQVTKKSTVIVLGKDTGDEGRELAEARDYLASRSYEAHLIKDLPEVPMMSTEEKVRSWAMAARFVFMVDRVPAGHLAEYVMLREQRAILALFRPKGLGSSFMMGDEDLVDYNFIKVFEFEETPLEVMETAIGWAETFAAKRASAYDAAYPWRQ